MKLDSGHEVETVEGEELASFQRDFTGYTIGMIRVHPGGWLFPSDFTRFADKIYNFKFKPSDVLVMTFMKCGTTWMQEMVWTMRNNSDLDHPATEHSINSRVPYLDCDMFLGSTAVPPLDPDMDIAKDFARLCPSKNSDDGIFLQMAEAVQNPRTIKTHLPFSFFSPSLLDTTKVVYVARHPGDVAVSFYHHVQLFKSINYVGTFERFMDYFFKDDLVYSPYWLHVREAWKNRHHPNLHFVFYEDLKANIMEEMKNLDTFLGTNLTQNQLEKIRDFTSFEKMQQRNNLFTPPGMPDPFIVPAYLKQNGGFFRKGVSGGWRGRLGSERVKEMEEWVARHFTDHGITFSNTSHQ